MTPIARIVRGLPVLAVVLAAACDHGEPFGLPSNATNQPFVPGAPTRLTYNPDLDRDATWLPDESGILYSADRADHGGDRCLLLLPPTGGRVTASYCNENPLATDSLKTYDAAAVSASGLVAFERTSRPPTAFGATYDQLAAGSFAQIAGAATVQSIPFSIGATLYSGIAQVRWVADTLLLYRAGFAGLVCLDQGTPCQTAFVTSGLDLVLQVPGQAPAVIPGTSGASSVALGADHDAVYFTLQGDSHVYRRVLSTGVVSAYYDFGAGVVARDVQVAGRRLVAIVGGNVTPLSAPTAGSLQYDQGGSLAVVDLDTGLVVMITSGASLYLHPALAPSGRHVVVESAGDLWLFDLP